MTVPTAACDGPSTVSMVPAGSTGPVRSGARAEVPPRGSGDHRTGRRWRRARGADPIAVALLDSEPELRAAGTAGRVDRAADRATCHAVASGAAVARRVTAPVGERGPARRAEGQGRPCENKSLQLPEHEAVLTGPRPRQVS